MDPSIDLAATSTCTTCRFVEDKSNYWTAVLYFKHPNGSYIRVNQMANHNTGPGLQSGGMTIYYFQPQAPTKDLNIVPFQKGFRMILGDPMRRTDNIPAGKTASKAVTFRCFQGDDPGPFGSPGNAPQDTVGFPPNQCTGGIRSNFFFPQCWDGINLDPPDHSSHVAQPEGTPGSDGLQFFGTDCPASHPVRLPLLFMEIVWDTRPFNTPELWPKDGTQPFVFSMGDPTGYGQHADYVFGWEGDSLKRAMDTCLTGSGIPADCPVLTWQSTEEMNRCRQAIKVEEVTESQYLDRLPGCNPIQAGPAPATPVQNCDAVATTITDAPLPTADPELIVPPWSVCYDGPGTHTLAPNCNATSTATETATSTVGPAIMTAAPA
ncbi:hypothetical protein DFP72DRAFT_922477 [Ephemerocybe angulata]|uniref:DUF1996 domain-containing protein n=1 Tax=Ephemerocybe angulata TaxID=980116 RepID=A0A8H6LWM3_9AGAR|nr:hypothetical protein DFP72DRAFT_922477 [Tulosesus angulatus]